MSTIRGRGTGKRSAFGTGAVNLKYGPHPCCRFLHDRSRFRGCPPVCGYVCLQCRSLLLTRRLMSRRCGASVVAYGLKRTSNRLHECTPWAVRDSARVSADLKPAGNLKPVPSNLALENVNIPSGYRSAWLRYFTTLFARSRTTGICALTLYRELPVAMWAMTRSSPKVPQSWSHILNASTC